MSDHLRSRGGKRVSMLACGLAIVAVLGASGAARALTHQIVAAPGATVTSYLNRAVIILKGDKAVFRNLDVAPHDVKSVTPGLFTSALIGTGKTSQVFGVNTLPKGKYFFYCSIHPTSMKGYIQVK